MTPTNVSKQVSTRQWLARRLAASLPRLSAGEPTIIDNSPGVLDDEISVKKSVKFGDVTIIC